MSHVAAEMQRLGFAGGDDAEPIPLLIGGATTSRAHTAIKIAPNTDGAVVYVPDASRAVGVATKLLSAEQKAGYVAEIAAEYETVRAEHAGRKGATLVSLLFLGGWLSPVAFLPDSILWLFIKILALLVVFFWSRATFPRYRYDQVMRLGWKVFIPVCLVWLAVVGCWMMSPWNIWK